MKINDPGTTKIGTNESWIGVFALMVRVMAVALAESNVFILFANNGLYPRVRRLSHYRRDNSEQMH